MIVTREITSIKRSYFKYITALLLFGSNGIIASNISLTSYEIVFMRTGIGSVLLVCLFAFTQRKIEFIKNKKDMLCITLSGIAMGISWICLYEAYSQIGVSISSLLYYCGPVIVMILSPFLFKEKLTVSKILGFIIVLIGVFLVNGNIAGENIKIYGIICGSISAVMYSIMVIFNKCSKKIIGLENSMIQLIVSFLTVAVFTGIKSGYAINVRGGDWIWILILGLLNTGIGCYFYFSSIGNLPVQTVAICGYLEPLSAVIFSVLILKEVMFPIQIIGAVFIIGGAIIGENIYMSKGDKNKRII